jgi:hypothetical protein
VAPGPWRLKEVKLINRAEKVIDFLGLKYKPFYYSNET